MFFFISSAFADAAAPVGAPNPIMQFIPLIGVMVVIYFFMIRPQSKKAQEHKTMVDSLQKGAHVVTNGGIFGTVVQVQEQQVILEISQDVHIVILKTAIASLVDNKVCTLKPKEKKAEKKQKAVKEAVSE